MGNAGMPALLGPACRGAGAENPACESSCSPAAPGGLPQVDFPRVDFPRWTSPQATFPLVDFPLVGLPAGELPLDRAVGIPMGSGTCQPGNDAGLGNRSLKPSVMRVPTISPPEWG